MKSIPQVSPGIIQLQSLAHSENARGALRITKSHSCYQILDSKEIILAGEIFKNNELLLYFKEEIVRLDNTINTDNISVLEDYEELKLLAARTLVVNKYIN